MEPANLANGHQMLGVGDNPSTTPQIQNDQTPYPPQYARLSESGTVGRFSTKGREIYDFTYGPDVQGSVPTTDHDLDTRAAVASQTEIGNPNGLIPTSAQTQEQLAAIQASDLPVTASRTSGAVKRTYFGHNDDEKLGFCSNPPVTHTGAGVGNEASDRLWEHRKSNYAPGYERAAEAVPQKTYRAEGHESVSFPHEQLGGNDSSGSRNVPPVLPPRTQGHDYALSSGTTGIGAARGSENGTRRDSPGASLGSKVKETFALVHVSGHDLPPGLQTSCYLLSLLLFCVRSILTRDFRAQLRLSGATSYQQLTKQWATKPDSWKTKRFSVRGEENTRLGSLIRVVVRARCQDENRLVILDIWCTRSGIWMGEACPVV